ncbi:MAG: alpha/beta hydrolase, partial [Gammaproteobacteria bacterium]|nr:alpha/beta hydrolase [Gammaproteobacteria bacterium]
MAERDGRRDQAPAPPCFVDTRDGQRIACRILDGREPGVVFLGGFSSDMGGTKALHLESFCRRRGRRYLRFDYRGHGESSGR